METLDSIPHPILGLIEVTQRCNLHCPVCFRAAKNLPAHAPPCSDPDFDEIMDRLKRLEKEQPDSDPTIAFTGGEPTLRDDLPLLVQQAHKLGFSRTEVITNGLRLATDLSFCRELKAAGLSQLGFQLDGFDDAIYRELRGRELLETKLKALENIKKTRLPTILAVCVARGINTDHVGDIIRYAVDNKDFVEHVNFQLIALPPDRGTGVTTFDGNNKLTLDALVSLIEKQTAGKIRKKDFYPPAYVTPIPAFIQQLTGKPQMHLFPLFHPACNLATYAYITKKKKIIPVNEALKIPVFLNDLERLTEKLKKHAGMLTKIRVFLFLSFKMLTLARRHIFRKIMIKSMLKRCIDPLANLKEILMISCADYMDLSTYREERSRHCGLFYLLGENRAARFCAYNVFGGGRLKNTKEEEP